MHRSNRRKSRINGTHRKRLIKTRGGAGFKGKGKQTNVRDSRRTPNVFALNGQRALKGTMNQIQNLTEEVKQNPKTNIIQAVREIVGQIPMDMRQAFLTVTVLGLVVVGAQTGINIQKSINDTAIANESCMQNGYGSYNTATRLCSSSTPDEWGKGVLEKGDSWVFNMRGVRDTQVGPHHAPYHREVTAGENDPDTPEFIAAKTQRDDINNRLNDARKLAAETNSEIRDLKRIQPVAYSSGGIAAYRAELAQEEINRGLIKLQEEQQKIAVLEGQLAQAEQEVEAARSD